MKQPPHRLGNASPHPLQGSAIDRSSPLQFRLDGRLIEGFAGDTVLSAVLAAGIDTLGRRDGSALALSTRHAPCISFAALAGDQQRALPMERTLVTPGADYVTTAPKLAGNPLARLLRRGGRSLQIDLDRPEALVRPWLGSPAESTPVADLVVVGGGLAGMAAALAGAKRGLRVVLVEAMPQLGGRAGLFGTQEGEETPAEALARMGTAIAAHDAITVLTGAEAFALRPGVVRLHQVEMRDGAPFGHVLDLRAPHIVLATGALERLPVFPGNRLPGVSGALEACEMAQRHGVWAGISSLIATSSSPAYRLAMLASDAGLAVQRIIDARMRPQSRFIEFSKAYGITMAAGTIVASVNPAPKGRGLVVTPRLAVEGLEKTEPNQNVDRLIVCGGWQPDLTLWHMAGGESSWAASAARIEPRQGPEGIAIAGSAASWFSSSACMASGATAVDHLLGRPQRGVEDRLIDPIYETPDAAAPIGDEPDEATQPAYLDAGLRHIERPRRSVSRWPAWLPFVPRPAGWSLADTPQPLDIADIAAGVQLGAIPAASAGIVAQERVGMVLLEGAESEAAKPAPAPLPLPPDYLTGRYADAELWLVAPDESRLLDVGALVYADADTSDPLAAIGVVVRIIEGKAIALVAGRQDQRASVRDAGRAIAIRLVGSYRVGMALDR